MATPDSTTTLKRCTKCKQEFPATTDYFTKRSDRDAFRSRCINCAREDNRKRIAEWRHENPEAAKEKHRLDAQTFRDRHREQVQANDRARRRKRFEQDPEKERERERERFKRRNAKNPLPHRLKSRRSNHKRRQWKLQNTTLDNHYTAQDIQAHIKTQEGRCWWCNKPFGSDFHIDHRIPLKRGGSNSAENVCISCAKCNRSKSDKMPWEWNGRLL